MGAVDYFHFRCRTFVRVTQGKGRMVADSITHRCDGADIRGEGNGYRSNPLRSVCGVLRNRSFVAAVLRRDDYLSRNVRADGDFRDDFVAEESV